MEGSTGRSAEGREANMRFGKQALPSTIDENRVQYYYTVLPYNIMVVALHSTNDLRFMIYDLRFTT